MIKLQVYNENLAILSVKITNMILVFLELIFILGIFRNVVVDNILEMNFKAIAVRFERTILLSGLIVCFAYDNQNFAILLGSKDKTSIVSSFEFSNSIFSIQYAR